MAYEKGRSGNPRGKPPGCNRTQKLRAKLMSAVPDLLDVLLLQAKNGDVQAARLILERTLPALKPESRAPTTPVPIEPDAVMGAVQTGAMTPDQAGEVMALLLAQAKVLEVTEIIQKIEALEQAMAALKPR
ncbi:MAG: DUF5681 domain-containing protein [Candidatus Contendobacter sp.]